MHYENTHVQPSIKQLSHAEIPLTKGSTTLSVKGTLQLRYHVPYGTFHTIMKYYNISYNTIMQRNGKRMSKILKWPSLRPLV